MESRCSRTVSLGRFPQTCVILSFQAFICSEILYLQPLTSTTIRIPKKYPKKTLLKFAYKFPRRHLSCTPIGIPEVRNPIMSSGLMDTQAGGENSQYAVSNVDAQQRLITLPDTSRSRRLQIHTPSKAVRWAVSAV